MGSKNYCLLVLTVLATFVWNGCKPDEDVEPPQTHTGNQVLVANQGNFGWGEGTLSVYYDGSETVDKEVYKKVNDKSLGNVFQSISKVNGQYVFVMNNSGSIVITDSSFKEVQTVSDFTSPRYFYQISDSEGYMTDLYSDHIYLIDIKSMSSVATLPTNGWSEKGVVLGDKFWYTAPETNKIYSLDTKSHKAIDSIQVGEKPESIVKDNTGTIWVLCKGDESKSEPARLVSMVEKNGEQTIVGQNVSGVPTSLVYDKIGNVVYFIADDAIWKLQIGIDDKPTKWVQIKDASLYNLAVNPHNGEVYVSDIKDFVSQSTIYRYATSGQLLDDFSAGIIAGDFFFP